MGTHPRRIRIGASGVARPVLRAIRGAAAAEGVRIQVLRGPVQHPEEAVALVVQPASLVSVAVSVHCPGILPPPLSEPAIALALTEIVHWSDSCKETWRALSTPLPKPRSGRMAWERPWALVDRALVTRRAQANGRSMGHEWNDPRVAEVLRGPPALQLHCVGRSLAPPDWVTWPDRKELVASLLGKVHVVLAPPGPLAWDATRSGLRVLRPVSPSKRELGEERIRLAHTLPAALAVSEAHWREILSNLLAERFDEDHWGTMQWCRQAICSAESSTRVRHGSPIGRVRRRLLKLQRDPEAFFRESKLPFTRALAAFLCPSVPPKQPRQERI